MSKMQGVCAYPHCTCREWQRCSTARGGVAGVDNVNHPAHYTTGKIEVIDFLRDQDFGYLAGNAVKYISRYRHKGKPLEDLKKARWYLQRLIDELEQEAGVMDKDQERALVDVAKERVERVLRIPPACNIGSLVREGLKLCLATTDGRHTWDEYAYAVRDDVGYRYVTQCKDCDAVFYCDVNGRTVVEPAK